VKKLTTEVEDMKRKKTSANQEFERQVIALREDIQRSQSRQKALREAGATDNTWKVPKESSNWQDEPHGSDPDEQLAFEVHQRKKLHQKLDQLEQEGLAQQQTSNESIAAREEELRQSRLELEKLQARAEKENIQLPARPA